MPVILSNASNSQIPGTYTLRVWHTLNQTDSDVTCSRSCDQENIREKD